MDSTAITTILALTGIIATSFFYAMSQTTSYITIPVILSNHTSNADSNNQSQSQNDLLTLQWKRTYDLGLKAGYPLAMTCALAFVGAAYFSGPGQARWLFGAAAVSQRFVGVYTAVYVLPVQTVLKRRAEEIVKGGEGVAKEGGGDAVELVRSWGSTNSVRANLGVVAVGLAVLGLVVG